VTDYTERREDLPMVRGRIEVADLVLRRMGRADFIPCRFDERLQDIPDNQLLAVSLRTCERRVRHAAVRCSTRSATRARSTSLVECPRSSITG
jgi:5-methylcytosine-specific restriction endonuclease McrBC regulatory subunit McrC